jgi:hypothetical protein
MQRRAFRTEAEAPAVVCAGLLMSPFVLDYDLALLAIPLIWLLREGQRSGFLPFEKALMALASRCRLFRVSSPARSAFRLRP